MRTMMTRTTRWMPVLGGVAALALTAAACGSGSGSGTGSSTAAGAGAAPTTTASTRGGYSYGGGSSTTTIAAPSGTQAALVSVASNELGQILVDGDGKTLYVYDKDPAGKSTCNGACAQAWPPLAAPAAGTPAYGSGLSPSMFSVITRDDGSKQIAVNGHPLYGWVADKQPGQTTGQGVNDFYVAGANGQKIDKD